LIIIISENEGDKGTPVASGVSRLLSVWELRHPSLIAAESRYWALPLEGF
jgi:hypothetical protein